MNRPQVLTRTPTLPTPSRREILRYLGAREESSELQALIDGALIEAEPLLRPAVVYARFSLKKEGTLQDIGFAKSESRDLAKALGGCDELLLFAATLGLELDRRISGYGRLSPARALVLQAIGTERIEALCDAFCKEIGTECRSRGEQLLPRFSPGYGDVPLTLQREIFQALDCPRRIGLTLTGEMLMSPTKSVTALVGIRRDGKTHPKERIINVE